LATRSKSFAGILDAIIGARRLPAAANFTTLKVPLPLTRLIGPAMYRTVCPIEYL